LLARWRGCFQDAHSRGSRVSDLLHANWNDRLCFAGWWRKGVTDERHCESEKDGSGTQGDETMKRKTTYKAFDAAAYLDNDAVIAEYLSAAAEDSNSDVFVSALGDVAKARGMAQIAKDSGLGRESLYKALSAGAHPRFETINSVLRALGVKFTVIEEHGR
jgi:probable addiction module antidote protein